MSFSEVPEQSSDLDPDGGKLGKIEILRPAESRECTAASYIWCKGDGGSAWSFASWRRVAAPTSRRLGFRGCRMREGAAPPRARPSPPTIGAARQKHAREGRTSAGLQQDTCTQYCLVGCSGTAPCARRLGLATRGRRRRRRPR